MNSKLIIVIDDNEDNFVILSRLIKSEYQTIYSDENVDVISLIEKHRPICILMDYHLETIKGIELLILIKSTASIADIPVVMLTGEKETSVVVDCMKNGASDYLVKGENEKAEILRVINRSIEKSILQKKIKEQQEQILSLSQTDELTRALNRRHLIQKIDEQIDLCNRTSNIFSVCMLDLDYFKKINDNYGHLIGDEVLKKVTEVIKNNIRSTDFVGRFGGDEFVIVLVEHQERTDEEIIELHGSKIDSIRKAIEENSITSGNFTEADLNYKSTIVNFTATFGFVLFEMGSPYCSELIYKADKALYFAKEKGRNCLGYMQDGKCKIWEEKN